MAKPKHDKPEELQPQPEEDAKVTGRKGGIKKPEKGATDTRPSHGKRGKWQEKQG